MGEHSVCIREVAGSTPVSSTTINWRGKMKALDILLRLQRMRAFMLREEYAKAYKVLLDMTDEMLEKEQKTSYRAKCAKEMRQGVQNESR